MHEKINEWINIRKELPKIDQLVEVKFYHPWLSDPFIEKAKFSVSNEGFIGFLNSNELLYDIDRISGWRPITEKLPDFSKLKEGDFLHVEWQNEKRILVSVSIGKFDEIDSCGFFIIKSSDCCRFHIKINDIKKITRINIEDKTFEEI
jgi:hypothetical protein